MKKLLNKNNLRRLRRIYAYIVGGGMTAFFSVYNIPTSTQGKILFWVGVGSVIIQVLNDSSKESLPALKPDPKN